MVSLALKLMFVKATNGVACSQWQHVGLDMSSAYVECMLPVQLTGGGPARVLVGNGPLISVSVCSAYVWQMLTMVIARGRGIISICHCRIIKVLSCKSHLLP